MSHALIQRVPLLAIYVPSADKTITLTVDNPQLETAQYWQIGRASDCAVRLTDGWVSGHHAVIRASPMDGVHNYDTEGLRRYVWALQDSGSTNGTYQGGIKVGGKYAPCPWIVIEEGDELMIGRTKLRFSFTGHFTQQGGDTDPGNNAEPDSATDVKAPPLAPIPVPPEADTLWEVVALILTLLLTGPKDTANWLWWLFLATVGSALVITLEWIRHR